MKLPYMHIKGKATTNIPSAIADCLPEPEVGLTVIEEDEVRAEEVIDAEVDLVIEDD